MARTAPQDNREYQDPRVIRAGQVTLERRVHPATPESPASEERLESVDRPDSRDCRVGDPRVIN